jgi:hypothetical protein
MFQIVAQLSKYHLIKHEIVDSTPEAKSSSSQGGFRSISLVLLTYREMYPRSKCIPAPRTYGMISLQQNNNFSF